MHGTPHVPYRDILPLSSTKRRSPTPYSERRLAVRGVLVLAVMVLWAWMPGVAKATPSHEALMCAHYAAKAYGIPESALTAILEVEGGRAGQAVANTNGTHDLGPMQINTLWLPLLKNKFGLTQALVRDNTCINVFVGGWILAREIRDTGSTVLGIARYHSRTPKYQVRYLKRVSAVLERRLASADEASTINGSP